jgi:hypothetical protein
MKKNHTQENGEKPSTKQSNPKQVCEQLDLFEWAGLSDESVVGFAIRSGL